MQGVNTTLMSGVASQVKPFAGIISTSGEVLQQHTEIVKTDTETLVEQDKILKKTTFNMSQFKDELKSGGSKFNDGIKELTGGLVDISGLTETVGKKFKAIGDIGKGIASPVTSLFKSFSREEVDADGNPDENGSPSLMKKVMSTPVLGPRFMKGLLNLGAKVNVGTAA